MSEIFEILKFVCVLLGAGVLFGFGVRISQEIWPVKHVIYEHRTYVKTQKEILEKLQKELGK